MILRFQDVDKAIEALKATNFKAISKEELLG
jgi:hypothetical protein